MGRPKPSEFQPTTLKDSYKIFCNLTKDKSIVTKISLTIEELQFEYQLNKSNIENLYRLIQSYGKMYLTSDIGGKKGRPII